MSSGRKVRPMVCASRTGLNCREEPAVTSDLSRWQSRSWAEGWSSSRWQTTVDCCFRTSQRYAWSFETSRFQVGLTSSRWSRETLWCGAPPSTCGRHVWCARSSSSLVMITDARTSIAKPGWWLPSLRTLSDVNKSREYYAPSFVQKNVRGLLHEW